MLGFFIFTSTTLIMRALLTTKENLKLKSVGSYPKSKSRFENVRNIYVIGIAGGSGSGKTTIAKAIYDEIDGLEKSKITENQLLLFDEQFRVWLLIGLFFLVLEMILSRTLFKSFI